MRKPMTSNNRVGVSTSERPLATRLLSGAGWALLGKGLTYPAGLALTMLLARLLTPEGLGGYFLATSLVALAVALVQLGLGPVTVKLVARALVSESPSVARQAVHVVIITVSVVSSITAMALALDPGRWLIGLLDSGELLYPSLRWIALLTLTMALVELTAEILRGFHDLRGASLLVDQLLQRLIMVLCLTVIFGFGMQLTLDQVLLLSALSALLAAVAGVIFIRANLSRIGYGGSGAEIGRIIRSGPPFLVIRLNVWLLNVAGVWVLGMFRPPEEVAIYGAANLLASLVLAPQMITNGVGAPIIVELFQQKRTGLLENIIRAAALFSLVPALLLAIIFMVYGDQLLGLIYGATYTQGLLVLAILAAGRCIAVACGAPSVTLAMTKYQKTVMKITTMISIVTLAAYILLAPRTGSLGVAMVAALSIALQNIVLAYVVRKKLKILTLPGVSLDAMKRFIAEVKKKS